MASALFIWAFIQSFIIGSIISLAKRATSNYILSGVFLVLSVNILLQYLFRYTDIKFGYPRILFLTDFLDFLLPALILWYVSSLFGQKTIQRLYWYFLPATLFLLAMTTHVLLRTEFIFQDYIGTLIHKATLFALVLWKSFIAYQLYTLINKRGQFLTSKTSLLQWPRLLLLFVIFTVFVALVQLVHLTIFVSYFPPSVVAQIRYLVQLNYILFSSSIILITIYFPVKYPKILSGDPLVKGVTPTDFPEGKEYSESLYKLIEEECIHLDSELNEKVLADRLGIHSYLLSRLLNDYIGKSFSQFINEKRVEAAQQMLKSKHNSKLTNFAVAVDSGFRSESVFYVNFKKITGMTPSQYKKSVQQEKEPA